MLDGVVMDIVAVPVEVLLISNPVLPEPSLPDATLSLRAHRVRDVAVASSLIPPGERGLDPFPPEREVGIVIGERPNAVQMVGKNHQGIYAERVFIHHYSEALSQRRRS